MKDRFHKISVTKKKIRSTDKSLSNLAAIIFGIPQARKGELKLIRHSDISIFYEYDTTKNGYTSILPNVSSFTKKALYLYGRNVAAYQTQERFKVN